jgi:hypothetical protein
MHWIQILSMKLLIFRLINRPTNFTSSFLIVKFSRYELILGMFMPLCAQQMTQAAKQEENLQNVSGYFHRCQCYYWLCHRPRRWRVRIAHAGGRTREGAPLVGEMFLNQRQNWCKSKYILTYKCHVNKSSTKIVTYIQHLKRNKLINTSMARRHLRIPHTNPWIHNLVPRCSKPTPGIPWIPGKLSSNLTCEWDCMYMYIQTYWRVTQKPI